MKSTGSMTRSPVQNQWLAPVNEQKDQSEEDSNASSFDLKDAEKLTVISPAFKLRSTDSNNPSVETEDEALKTEVAMLVKTSRKNALKEVDTLYPERLKSESTGFQFKPFTSKSTMSSENFGPLSPSTPYQRMELKFSGLVPKTVRSKDPAKTAKSFRTLASPKLSTYSEADYIQLSSQSQKIHEQRKATSIVNSNFRAEDSNDGSAPNSAIKKPEGELLRIDSHSSNISKIPTKRIPMGSNTNKEFFLKSAHSNTRFQKSQLVNLPRMNQKTANQSLDERTRTHHNQNSSNAIKISGEDPSAHVPNNLLRTLSDTFFPEEKKPSARDSYYLSGLHRNVYTPLPKTESNYQSASFRKVPNYLSHRSAKASFSKETNHDLLESPSETTGNRELFERLFTTSFGFGDKLAESRQKTYSRVRAASGINEGMLYTSEKSIKAAPNRSLPREIGEVIEVYDRQTQKKNLSAHFAVVKPRKVAQDKAKATIQKIKISDSSFGGPYLLGVTGKAHS